MLEETTIGRIVCSMEPEKSSIKNGSKVHRRVRKVMPPQIVWPLLFTLGNLVAGFAAIHYATKGENWVGPWGWSGLTMAGSLVFLGMFLDSVDGSVARLTKSVTELGAMLDSLADLVTCGVAPAMMVLALVGSYLGEDGHLTVLGPDADMPWGKVVWAIAAVYVCCTALRLARFNVETHPEEGPDDDIAFHGIPSPGAAGVVVALIMLHQHILANGVEAVWIGRAYAFGVPIVALSCALAMVSNIPYKHFVSKYLVKPQSFRFLSTTVIIIFSAIWWFQETVAFGFVWYALTGPIQVIRNRRQTTEELQ
jgi:CDP-diacylglycerol--serine O-phosphatidyltransferase